MTQAAHNESTDPPRPSSPYEAAEPPFLDVLVLFLRTIPLYPDAHGRVIAVTEKFQAALRKRGTATIVEATGAGLKVDGDDHTALSGGAAGFRDALVRTGVSRVTFAAEAPHASYVVFARSLQRNARLASQGHLTFHDLWMAPIEGIGVEEQTFTRDDFSGEPGDGDAVLGRRHAGDGDGAGDGTGLGDGTGHGPGGTKADGTGDGVGSGGVGSGTGGAGLGSGGSGTSDAPGGAAAQAVRAAPRLGRALRSLVIEDEVARAALDRVRARLAARGETDLASSGSGRDVLDHLLASLPIEARLDLRRGVDVARAVLLRLAASLDGGPESEATKPTAALLQALQQIFPEHREHLTVPPMTGTPSPARPLDPVLDDAEEEEALDDVAWATASSLTHLPPATFDANDGIADPAGIVTHAIQEFPVGPRLDALRAKLANELASRSPLATTPCAIGHLRTALAEPPGKRDTLHVRALAGAIEESRVDLKKLTGTGVDPDLVVAAFPALFSPFVAGGGSAGFVARTVGRAAILAAGPELTGLGGALAREELVQRILGERSRDVLPFIELMLGSKEAARRRLLLAALRRTDLPSVAAVALRVVPDDRISDDFARVLCEDGFQGTDSHRADDEAIASVAAVAEGRTPGVDDAARVYATKTLFNFGPVRAIGVVRRLAERRMMLFGAPKDVRRAAVDLLARWGRGERRDGTDEPLPQETPQ